MKLEAFPCALRALAPVLLAVPLTAQDPQPPQDPVPEPAPQEPAEPEPGEKQGPPAPREPVEREDPIFGPEAPAPEEPAAREELPPETASPTGELVVPERRPAFFAVVGFGVSDLGYGEAELTDDLAGASGITPDVDSVDDTDGGVKAYAGYWLHERVAVEVGFVDLGSVRSEFEFVGPPGSEAAIEQAIRDEHAVLGSGVTAGLRAIVLDGSDLDLSLKAGGFFWEAESEVSVEFNGTPLAFVDERSGTDLFYGAGLHYDLASAWSLQLEYELYEIEDETAGQLALSVRYAFDL